MLKTVLLSAFAALALTSAASADDAAVQAKAQAYAQSDIKKWVADPDIVAAINAANTERAGYDQAKIDALDKQWKAEVGGASHPLVDQIAANPSSAKLKAICEGKGGLVTEAFLMDAKGMNVGMCDPTSDFWQGDEAKWQKTFQAGPDAIFVDKVEQDESTQKFEVQTSMTIVDPASGKPIGAITVGLDADMLTQQ
ncbi:MAG TPA: hypothetical protein VMT54_21290 [Candidatus Cybelea sp.]|nr:hypothetical protein [Candidatus Cybelea sp.]